MTIAQRRITGAWEKENFSPETFVDATGMETSNDEVASLRGWFNKVSICALLQVEYYKAMPHLTHAFISTQEKRDGFKKGQALLPIASSNRRWFTIEHGDGKQSKDLLICYYKTSLAEKESRCGWLFLNDIIALSQDIPGSWITIEHPTRIMRIQSPNPAQHRLWYSTLSKYCKNARKDVSKASLSTDDTRPSLPYFSEAAEESLRKARRDSLNDEKKGPPPSTPKDELQFLREITGGKNVESIGAVGSKNLFPEASFKTVIEDVPVQPIKNVQDEADKLSSEGERTESNASSPSSSIGTIPFASESEENAKASELLRFDRPQNMGTLCDDTPITTSRERYGDEELDTYNSRKARSESEDSMLSTTNYGTPILSNIKKSSSYRLHFGDSEDKILPDDDFLDDWDV